MLLGFGCGVLADSVNMICGVSVVVGNYQWLLCWLCYISIDLQVCCTNCRQHCEGVRSMMQVGDGEYQPEVLCSPEWCYIVML